MLDFVKNVFPNILSEDVLEHYNIERGESEIENALKFSTKDRAVMTTDRIDYLIEESGAGARKDYAQSWITSINPTDFLNMTLGEKNQNRDIFDTMPGDYGSTVNDYDYIEGLKSQKRQTPYLQLMLV